MNGFLIMIIGFGVLVFTTVIYGLNLYLNNRTAGKTIWKIIEISSKVLMVASLLTFVVGSFWWLLETIKLINLITVVVSGIIAIVAVIYKPVKERHKNREAKITIKELVFNLILFVSISLEVVAVVTMMIKKIF